MTFLEFWCKQNKKFFFEKSLSIVQLKCDGPSKANRNDFHIRAKSILIICIIMIITGRSLPKGLQAILKKDKIVYRDKKNTELVNLQFQVAYLSNSIMHNHLSLLLIWPCGIPFSKVVMYVPSIKFWWCPFYLFFNSLFRTRGILSFGMKKRKRWI